MEFGSVPAPATVHFERVHRLLVQTYIGVRQEPGFCSILAQFMNRNLIQTFANQAFILCSPSSAMEVVFNSLKRIEVRVEDGVANVHVPPGVIEDIDMAFGTTGLQLAREIHES